MSAIQKRQSQKILEDEKELEKLLAEQNGENDSEEEIEEVEVKSKKEVKEEKESERDSSETEGTAPDQEPDEGNWKKRFGDLRRHSQSKETEFKSKLEEKEARIAELEAQSNKVELPASDEDLEAWKGKYPDVAAIVETVAIKIANKKFEEAQISIAEINNSRKEAAKETAKASIVKKHPDFDKITESDEFHDWSDAQPKWVQDALFENSDDALSVIRAIDLYKLDTGVGSKKENSDPAKEAAMEVKAKAKVEIEAKEKPKFKESQVEKMSNEEFAANEEAIDEAIRNGQFIYDLSGAAR